MGDTAEKNYIEAVEAFHVAEPLWRARLLTPGLSSADAAQETAEIERLFNQMQITFRALMTARRPK